MCETIYTGQISLFVSVQRYGLSKRLTIPKTHEKGQQAYPQISSVSCAEYTFYVPLHLKTN